MRPPRVRYRPRVSLLSLVSSVVGAPAILIFLQQRGSVFPTPKVELLTLLGGLAVGLIVPSLGQLVAVRRMNRRLARLTASRQGSVEPEVQL